MAKLIFSFDTEDYVNPISADGILQASKMIREAGFRPCQNVVAWTAKALEKWGRQDVLDEISKCEIALHTLKHSYHPTVNEYTDLEDFDKAMELLRSEEDECAEVLKKYFGVDGFPAACPPGKSYSYVAQYGYADMGIPIYDGGLTFDAVQNRPVGFCNMLSLHYDMCFDSFTWQSKEDVLAIKESYANNDIWICYHHPAMSRMTKFADEVNFMRENKAGEWTLSPRETAEASAKFNENLALFLDDIKKDKRFEPSTYADIAAKYVTYRVVKPYNIPEIKKAIDEDLFPVTLPESLSLSDIMLACRDFLLGKDEHVCEKVYGFLDVPYAVGQPVKVTLDEMKESAEQIKDGKFLPAEINVGGKRVGPADWLRAALALLSGKNEYVITPDAWQIDLNEFPDLRDQSLKGTWVHADTFEDKYISNRARLQSWTIRLPKGTKRRIF